MKKFFIKMAVLLLILAVGDFLIGKGMDYVYANVMSGGQRRNNFIANEMDADILVFGSSRAIHHYNAQLIQDSLGLSCYNCGQDGNGIMLDYGRLLLVKKRYTQKCVIVDVTPGYDLLKSTDGIDLGWLRPYYDNEGIKAMFADIDGKEKYKMLSSAYRYNSFFLTRLASYLSGKVEEDKTKGFMPIDSRPGDVRINKMLSFSDVEYDSLKLDYFSKLIDLAAGSRLYFVISPVWYDMKTRREEEIKPLKAICRQKGIPLVDFTNHPKYLRNDSLFHDGTHLNSLGADIFSRDVVQILREDKR